MSQLLVINSSPVTDNSNTRQLVNRFVDNWQQQHPESRIVQRDIGRNPPPHIDEVMIGAYYTPSADRNEAQRQAIHLSDELVDELEAADTLVIGSPMHNFSITSALKTYIDHVARVGRTFQYGEAGPEGLLKNKKVYLLTARGGSYTGDSPAKGMNHQDTYLQTVLGFLGLIDVTLIHAEGVSGSAEGVLEAKSTIAALSF